MQTNEMKMTADELYELAMEWHHFYSICQQSCDGMGSCKLYAGENDKGCLKWFNYYYNLAKEQSENLKK